MKINEVEKQAGITKKNIRFYEEQGLLAPRRNSENGYREYGQEEVETLKQIKLLRKLGVPLEEIRQMQSGIHTVGDGMRRHLVTMERDRHNLDHAIELCRTLKDREIRLEQLETDEILHQMECMEQGGTTFMNKQNTDAKPVRYVAPVVVTVFMLLTMGAVIWLLLWAYQQNPADAPPLALMGVFVAIPAVVIFGVCLAPIQRVREIQKGEIDDAKKY